MSNVIALLLRNAPNNVRVSRTMTIGGNEVEISAAAFYDIFAVCERLEDFVRDVAAGEFDDAELAARELMDDLKFL